MSRARFLNLAIVTLVPAAAISLTLSTGWAQSPAAPATPPPAGGRGPGRTMVPDSFSILEVGK